MLLLEEGVFYIYKYSLFLHIRVEELKHLQEIKSYFHLNFPVQNP